MLLRRTEAEGGGRRHDRSLHFSTEPENKIVFLCKVREWNVPPDRLLKSVPNMSPKTSGYCWPTPTCRNWCAQHAFLEGKKAEETPPRKSTSRTLKEVNVMDPPVQNSFREPE